MAMAAAGVDVCRLAEKGEIPPGAGGPHGRTRVLHGEVRDAYGEWLTLK